MADTTSASNDADKELINLGMLTLQQRAAEFAAEQAYKARRLELVDIPMTQVERDKLAYQAAVTAADNAYRDRKFDQVDLPQLQLAFRQDGRAGLQQMLDARMKSYGLLLEGEKVENLMNQTALQAAQIGGDDAFRRDRMQQIEATGLQLDTVKVQQQGLTATLDDVYRYAELNGVQIPEEQRRYIETGMQGMQQAAQIATSYAQMGLTAREIEAKLQQQGMQGYEAVAQQAAQYSQMGLTADQIQNDLMNTSLKSLIATGDIAAKYAAMGLDAQTVQNATQELGMKAIQASMQDQIATAGVQTDQAKLALQAAQQGDQTALQAMQLAAGLTGPKNAFQQQAVMWGLNQQGLSRAVGALSGQYDLPTTQANQANPEVAGLGSLGQDILNAGGTTTRTSGSDVAEQIAREFTNRGTGGWNPNDAARRQLGNYGTQQMNQQVAAPTAPADVQQGLTDLAQASRDYIVQHPDMDPSLRNLLMEQAGTMAGATVTQPNVNDNMSYADLQALAQQAGSTQLNRASQNYTVRNQLAQTAQTAADIAARAGQAVDTGQANRDALAQVRDKALNNEMPQLDNNADVLRQLQEQVTQSQTGADLARNNVGTGGPPPTFEGTPVIPPKITPTPTPGQPVQPSNLDDLESLSAIWKARPDLEAFFKSKGWDTTQPEQKLAAVQEWAKLASAGADPLWVAAGGDVTKLAQMNNWAPEPTIWQPARALQGVEERLGDPFVAWVSGDKGGSEFDYNRNVQLGGKGQKLWGPDWRWETATTAQKLQLGRQWVNETPDGIAAYQDPIYALRELGGMADNGGPAWMTPRTQMQQINAFTKAPATLAQVPTEEEGSRHMAQQWILGDGNPQFKQQIIARNGLPPNPTIEQATAAFKDWYVWQSGMGGINFPPGQQFKLVDATQQTGWTPPIQKVVDQPITVELGAPQPVVTPTPIVPEEPGPVAPTVQPEASTVQQVTTPTTPTLETMPAPAAPTVQPTVGAGATVMTPGTTPTPTTPTPTTPTPATPGAPPTFGPAPTLQQTAQQTLQQPTTQQPSEYAKQMALKQLGNFMPSAQQVAGTLPGGAAGPPTFGADEEMWKKAAAAAQKQYEQPAA